MQANSVLWDLSQNDLRRLGWKVLFAFEKQFDDNITFFTLNTSQLDGPDFLQGTNNVVQEWDKYEYVDYTDRVVNIVVVREDDRPSSMSMAMADVTLNNYDDLFDPTGDSPLASNILPGRPIRIFLGFDTEIVPQFVGLTERMPAIDEKAKTVSFHCVDFLSYTLDIPLDESVMLLDYRTDEIIEYLMGLSGVLPAQMSLDVGNVTVPFFSADKGEKVYEKIFDLVTAEMGRLFMDENGVICFRNRQGFNNSIVGKFNSSENIVERSVRREDDLINVVTITSNVRTVQPNQKFWESFEAIEILAGQSIDLWADFTDPVVSVDAPSGGGATSFFVGNASQDGSGADRTSDITLSSSYTFSTSYKMTFTNTSGSTVWLTSVVLFASPALITSEIYVREEDAISVGKYGERVYDLVNNYFVSETDARSFALSVISDYGEYAGLEDLDVKGSPQLQLGDIIEANVFGKINLARIIKINNKMDRGQFVQQLRVKNYVERSFFILNESILDGGDVLAP